MKQTKKTLLQKAFATIISLTCIFSISNISSFSAVGEEYSQDGIDTSFSVIEDRETNKFNAVLTISNANKFDIENIMFDFEEPTGYKIVAETIPSKIALLKNGEPITLSWEYEKDKLINTASISLNNSSSSNSVNNSRSLSNNLNSNLSNSSRSSNNNYSNNTQSTKSSPVTDDSFPLLPLSVVLIVSGIIARVCLKKKNGKQLLSLFLVGTMCSSSLIYLKEFPVLAEAKVHSFTIEEVVNNITFKVNISYSYQSNESNNDEKESDSYRYYKENSEEVVAIIDASNPDNLLSGAEAVALLKSKGFDKCPVTVYYDINGEYINEREVEENSTEKYPMYHTFYYSETDIIWKIMIIGKSVVAVPMSYIVDINPESQVMFSESETISSYSIDDKAFYITIPKRAAVDVNILDINAEKLKKITNEEVADYEKN